ncbi:signal transduction histidine kinase [Conyzicola lurida]|uniref:histidine kinase n=1 Tax=Conyzicola lurida TaxID=1172621 RepID=A0A841ARG8_9MICO|nr:histidine kinase [Conyzicola lurida]MBB5844019.1 signal transduction histidine kinase [Conyzicola lurida]
MPTLPTSVSALWRRPLVRDALRAAALLAAWLLAILLALRLGWYPFQLESYIYLGVITALALLLCRRWPLVGLVLVGIASVWPAWYFDVPELRIVPLVVAGFIAAASGLQLRIAAPVVVVSVVLTVVPSFMWGVDYTGETAWVLETLVYSDPSTRILAGLVAIGAMLLGASVHAQRRTVASLRERNAELERLREADAARIVAEERTAIARDIHDVVAHHISAMVIRAQAADRVADTRPEELRDTVRWIAGTGQDALGAMRQVVRVLRSDTGAPALMAPADFAAALDAIVGRVRDTGLVVEVAIDPDLDLTTLQQAAVVRIVQEGLTNVMLHSDATAARIALGARDRSIELRIDDEGSEASAVSSSGGGSGIRGMRERAEAAGGTLVAGRLNGRGWTVLVRLPEPSRELVRA